MIDSYNINDNNSNIINCKKISQDIFNEIVIEVNKYKNIGIPHIVFIIFNDKKESNIYLNNIKVKCEKIGINVTKCNCNNNILENELINLINNFNNNNNINGIIIQSPLPCHLNKDIIRNSIINNKDIEGLNNYNIGSLIDKSCKNIFFTPCTPLACMEIFKRENIDLKGKTITIIGKSDIVGIPLSLLLLQNDATVTVCHIETINLIYHLKHSDIVISACGQPNMIKKDWLKNNVIIIDIGINIINNNNNNNIVGDVDFNQVKKIAQKITPVPGGVGLITTMMLIYNSLNAFKIQNNLY